MLTILQGDAIEQLRTLPEESVQCCVTSPPYWGLRDYSTNGQLGLEKTPEEYVAKMVEVFREVRRVLRKDGTCWVNLGDAYAHSGACGGGSPLSNPTDGRIGDQSPRGRKDDRIAQLKTGGTLPPGLKPKDLCGIPWRVAFALQSDGWWLRSDIIWAKPNPMPESVTDRPTKSHEYLFLLTKSASYFYDAEAIKEPVVREWDPATNNPGWLAGKSSHQGPGIYPNGLEYRATGFKNGPSESGRNKRSVWTVATSPYPEAHFATYPPDLIKPCIMAGTSAKGCCAECGAPWERVVERTPSVSKDCPKTVEAHHARGGTGLPCGTVGQSGSGRINGTSETVGWYPSCRCNNDDSEYETLPVPCTVLDPFGGSGTTGMVALELGRKAILIELNPKYCDLIRQRCDVTPGLQLA